MGASADPESFPPATAVVSSTIFAIRADEMEVVSSANSMEGRILWVNTKMWIPERRVVYPPAWPFGNIVRKAVQLDMPA